MDYSRTRLSHRVGAAVRGLDMVARRPLRIDVHANDPPAVFTPLRVESDHNGVNVVNGKTRMSPPVLSVPGAPNLRFDRAENAAPYVNGTISGVPGGAGMASYAVHTGEGSSESFRCPDFDPCESVTGTGSVFNGAGPYIFLQAGSGARYVFDRKHVHTSGTQVSTQYYASSVTGPNGESLTYTYQTATVPGDSLNRVYYRPTRVTSNLGFHITISYHPGAFGTNGWNQVQQATLYNSDFPTTPLARLTYELDGTITDIGGRATECTGCATGLGGGVEGTVGTMQLPTESVLYLEAERLPGSPSSGVVGTVTVDGVAWNYAYTNLRVDTQSNGLLYDQLTVTGPNNYNTVYTLEAVYDRFGFTKRNRIAQITDAIGRTTAYDFDWAFRVTRIVYPEGNEVSVGYDVYGNIESQTRRAKPASGLADITETAYYEVAGCTGVDCYRPVWHRDARGLQTDFLYNTYGQLTQKTEPADADGLRRKTFIEYQTAPNGVSRREVVRICGDVTTPCGTSAEIRTEFDYWGDTFLPSVERRIDGISGETLVTAYQYDNAGRLKVVDGPLSGTDDAVYYYYDLHGRREWEIGPLGNNGYRNAQRFTYRPSDDKLTKTEVGTVTNPLNPVSTFSIAMVTDVAYDPRRNPKLETVSAAGVTLSVVQRTFQNSNRLECETRRMNPAGFGSLPGSACALGTSGTFGADRIMRNIYNAAGELLRVQRAYGTPLQQDYAVYTYWPNGQLASVTDANGNKAALRYDGHDRQNRWVFPSKTNPGTVNEGDYEAYGYDPAGNRTSLRKRDAKTLTYQFDGLNRVTRKTVPASASGAAGYSVFYGYNVLDLQTYARFTSATTGEGVINDYDGFGRLETATNTMGGVSRALSYGYDAGSRRTRLTFPDGHFFQYDYDAASRLEAIRQNGTTIVTGITYDSLGRRDVATVSGTSKDYEFDDLSRLESLTLNLSGTSADQILTYAYNPASQIVTRTSSNAAYTSTTSTNESRSYTVNGLNQYTSVGGVTHLYDLNGNLAGDGPTVFGYDSENRLVAANSGTTTTTLTYDPLGRLYRIAPTPGQTTQFLYDGDQLVAEYDGSGSLKRRFVHGAGVDEPLLWYEGSGLGTRRGLLADHQGSVIAVANSSGGSYGINGYDSWGIPNSTNFGRFQYTGQAWLPELGLYHYKARIYSPGLGRFLQTDPVGYEDQVNLYAYVGNDPLNNVDPSGLRCVGTGKDSQCTIDQMNIGSTKEPNWVSRSEGLKSGKVSEEKLAGLEESITSAYVTAQEVGENSVTIKGDDAIGIPDITVTGNEIASALASVTLRVNKQPWYRSPRATAQTSLKDGAITFNNKAYNSNDFRQSRTTIHEGLHVVEATRPWIDPIYHRFEHQTPFNNAAEGLLNLASP